MISEQWLMYNKNMEKLSQTDEINLGPWKEFEYESENTTSFGFNNDKFITQTQKYLHKNKLKKINRGLSQINKKSDYSFPTIKLSKVRNPEMKYKSCSIGGINQIEQVSKNNQLFGPRYNQRKLYDFKQNNLKLEFTNAQKNPLHCITDLSTNLSDKNKYALFNLQKFMLNKQTYQQTGQQTEKTQHCLKNSPIKQLRKKINSYLSDMEVPASPKFLPSHKQKSFKQQQLIKDLYSRYEIQYFQ